jgi:hypothetical protein
MTSATNAMTTRIRNGSSGNGARSAALALPRPDARAGSGSDAPDGSEARSGRGADATTSALRSYGPAAIATAGPDTFPPTSRTMISAPERSPESSRRAADTVDTSSRRPLLAGDARSAAAPDRRATDSPVDGTAARTQGAATPGMVVRLRSASCRAGASRSGSDEGDPADAGPLPRTTSGRSAGGCGDGDAAGAPAVTGAAMATGGVTASTGWATGDGACAAGGCVVGGAGTGAGLETGGGTAGTGGAGAGAGAGAAAGGGGAGVPGRAGRRPTGSTYPSACAATRIPRWAYGTACSDSPLEPIVPTGAPSVTESPLATLTSPRWNSVTEKPSCVRIAMPRPWVGTEPANVTVPAAGARTGDPAGPATSIPRC